MGDSPRGRLMTARLLFVLLAAIAANAHDPITTKLTWNREISRIVYSRCIACHRPRGQAFSLLAYRDARPWAKAIAEETLERRMPPWGAVKGFGDFRNDQALTQQQLDWIAHWADGGAPEGDPKDRPAIPKRPPRKPSPAARAIIAFTDYTLGRPILLDAIVPMTLPAGASAQITVELPDGSVEPLVWLHDYQPRYSHPFLLRTPLPLARGAVIRGIPPGWRIALLPTSR
jgi:hypothetical protein